MSSNLSIKKVCQFCNNEFIAKQLHTKYCSQGCSKKYNKAVKRNEIISSFQNVKKSKKEQKTPTIELVNKKDFLSVREASVLLNMSLRTVYRLIENKELNAYNFSERKTLIRRRDIDYYFELNLNNLGINKAQIENIITPENSYSINEIIKKYNISNGALYNIIHRFGIEKKSFGKHVLVKKSDIDKIFSS
jgi:excisionase family DNA binding protein